MRLFLRRILTVCGIFAVAFGGSATIREATRTSVDALSVAHELDNGVFHGWSYGAYSSAEKHLDCTSFISAVMDTILARLNITYTPEIRRDVMIIHSFHDRDIIQEGPDPADPRFAGVVYAIEKYDLGTRITDMSQVRPGDFIQYWKQRSDGTWFGHASLIESLHSDNTGNIYKARIFGSHRSTDGIAVSNFELLLSGKDRLVYIGRIGGE
ncbi:MAG: hypothetical protein U5N56_03315 [Candidatus Marinimicrobia bacterium]|nr:hypothetical protein [Candidatus Neomarinimicrobiota bacterium]